MVGKRGRRVTAAQWGDLSCTSLRQQMLDALIFSLAAYEDSDAAIKTILTAKYDLPVGILEIVADYLPLKKAGIQPYLVGRGTSGEVVVAFRGTADIRDVVADLQFIHRRLPFAEGSAHLGFVERAASIDVDYFITLLQKGKSLIFTGHSLGGAVASLVALRVLEEATCAGFCPHVRRQCQVITFGAPLFANLGLAELINTKYRDLFHHVVSKHDLVPKILPLVAAGHRLVGLEPYHMQLLRIGRAGLELAEKFVHVPLAGVIRALEAKIPRPMRSLLWGTLRVLRPGETQHQYAFAGQVVMLDRGEVAVERAVRLTKAEELNFWFRQLGYGLGLGRFGEHKILSYYAGLGRGMRSKLLEYLSKGNAGVEEKAQVAKVILEGVERQLSQADVGGSDECQVSVSERVVRTYRSAKAGRGKKRVMVEESSEKESSGGAGRGGDGGDGGCGAESHGGGQAEDRFGIGRRSFSSRCDSISFQSCFCSPLEQCESHRMEALSEVLHMCESSGRQGLEGEGERVGGGADLIEWVEEDRGLGSRVGECIGARRKLKGEFTGTFSERFKSVSNDDSESGAELVPAWSCHKSECASCQALQLYGNAEMVLDASKRGGFVRRFRRVKVGMVALSLASIVGQIKRGRLIDKVWMFFSAVRFVVFNPFF